MAAEFLERMGARMRERREELGLSRSNVARAMPGKTNENQVYRWETGRHRPNDDALEALAAALQVDVAYFMASEPSGAATPDPFASGDAAQLADLVTRIQRIETKVDKILTLMLDDALSDAELLEAAAGDTLNALGVGDEAEQAPSRGRLVSGQ